MSTLASWVEETRAHLEGDRSEDANQLDAPYVAGSGTVVLRHSMGNVGPGTLVTIGANTLRVMATNPVQKTLTVIAGFNGSTDVNVATGSLVRVNPRFTDHGITKALNGALATLSSPTAGLFKVASTTLTKVGAVEGYDLSGVTGLLRVLEVRRQVPGPSLGWPRVPAALWDVLRSAPSGFVSGMSLRLMDGDLVPGYGVEVVYAAAFTAISGLTVDTSTTGIPATADDLPPLGAALRVMSGREVARNALTAQGDARRAAEVPAGAIGASANGLRQLFAQRVAEENARLRQQFPVGR